MPTIRTDDGVDLHYEEAAAQPMVFVHEFAGDCRSWEPQLRSSPAATLHRLQCAGYPPSSVPADPAAIRRTARRRTSRCDPGAGRAPAHLVGCRWRLRHAASRAAPCRAGAQLEAAGVGYGAAPDKRAQIRAETDAAIAQLRRQGMARMAGPTPRPARLSSRRRPAAAMPVQGSSANTPRGLGADHERGASRAALAERLADVLPRLPDPTLIVAGDEDDPR